MKQQNSTTNIVKQILLGVMLALIFAKSAYSAPKIVLVLGDSLSAEYGLARGTGWVALLEKRLAAEKIAATVINASISGDTSSGGAARLDALLAQHHPNIVIIELGGNDGLRGLPIEPTTQNFATMIKKSQQAKAKVVLVGMQIPPNYGRTYTEQFSAMYPTLAKQTKSVLVPFLLEGVADQPTLFQADNIHPKAAAHPRMLDNVWPYLKPLLK